MINVLCTSKPVDGLLYYSYEYVSYLNESNIDARLVIVGHKHFSNQDYIQAIKRKYIHCKDIVFEDSTPDKEDVTLIMGRSMMTISWQNFKDYTLRAQSLLKKLFSSKVISVYSENHPVDYFKALDFYSPDKIIDICDTEVYPNGIGEHFEKRINFSIYKPYSNNVQFRYLFMGTNDKYYASAEKSLLEFPDHGILTYHAKYVNPENNNIFVPIDNVLGIFDTYVYTKETFDPAPRIIQECKYFKKPIIYHRDKNIRDGGWVYMKRSIKKLDITPIINSLIKLTTV